MRLIYIIIATFILAISIASALQIKAEIEAVESLRENLYDR